MLQWPKAFHSSSNSYSTAPIRCGTATPKHRQATLAAPPRLALLFRHATSPLLHQHHIGRLLRSPRSDPRRDLIQNAIENITRADALIFSRTIYERMESYWRQLASDSAQPFAQAIHAAKKYVVSSTSTGSIGTWNSSAATWAQPFSSSNNSPATASSQEA